jgi:hypothetical protein
VPPVIPTHSVVQGEALKWNSENSFGHDICAAVRKVLAPEADGRKATLLPEVVEGGARRFQQLPFAENVSAQE